MWAKLFKNNGKRAAETPELYLKLTERCMKEVHSMLSSGASASPKFNHEQCKYLVDKLEVVVKSAHFFFESINFWYTRLASDEDKAQSLDIFKLLFVLGEEVQSFIQGCCKDAWLQPAFVLTNVPEGISSLGFDLEFCTNVFSYWNNWLREPLTAVAVSDLRKVEDQIVKEKSNIDGLRLYVELNAFVQSSNSNTIEVEHARFLLERLKSTRLKSTTMEFDANLTGSLQSSHPEMSISKLKQVKKLGSGSFGDVHEVNWLGTKVARKTFYGAHAPDFQQEVSILEGLCHPNIVSLLSHMKDERKCYMIMELMDEDLRSLMDKRLEGCEIVGPPFSIPEAVHIMLQVAEGMFSLHEKRIVHRDVKSSKILVKVMKASEVGVENLHVKVADFGLSKTKEKSQTYSHQTHNQGTTRWMAPEMMQIANTAGQAKMLEHEVALKYPFKVDVYSFAILCYEILTGDLPFSDLRSLNDVKIKVLDGGRPQLPDGCPERLKDLIEACWSREPSMRPSFGDICAELRQWKCAQFITSCYAASLFF